MTKLYTSEHSLKSGLPLALKPQKHTASYSQVDKQLIVGGLHKSVRQILLTSFFKIPYFSAALEEKLHGPSPLFFKCRLID